jgi:hypothetical protein
MLMVLAAFFVVGGEPWETSGTTLKVVQSLEE